MLGLSALSTHRAEAQTSLERTALNNLQKKKWSRSHSQLQKSIRKDSLNVIAEYIYARFFFSTDNPEFNIDSAARYSVRALRHFTLASSRRRERMKRFPADSTVLNTLIIQIDSSAFEFAKRINTEVAYLFFLEHYPGSQHHLQAIELRDEAAYLDALRKNTYAGFSAFLDKYPQAGRATEAKKRYEKSLFETKTHDKLLASYDNFLKDYPQTSHRKEIEKNIFEIATASGEVDALTSFLRRYPDSYFSNKARCILFHIISETDSLIFTDISLNDSLQHIATLANTYLVPFLKDGKFGFMDDAGHEVISPTFGDIPPDYLCGNLTEDVLVLPDKILAKNGSLIYEGSIEKMDDLGYGFLKIITDGYIRIIHKSGFLIDEPFIEDVKLLNGKFIALKNKLWSLFSLAGRRLTIYEWDDIYNLNDIIVFKKGGKSILATAAQVGLLANQQNLKTKDSFDEVKPWKNNLIWARAADFEGILDHSLKVIIPFEKQLLIQVFFGTIASSLAGAKVYNLKNNELGTFQNVNVNPPWLAVKQASSWRLFDVASSKYQSPGYDSVSFTGAFAIGHQGDSVHFYFTPHKVLTFNKVKYEFIPGKDSTSFLRVHQTDKKITYNEKGQRLFTDLYDKVQYAGNDLFIVSKKEKKGLIGIDGKIVLPVDFDAIGSVSNQTISLLKNKKFGLFDLHQKRQIKPQYDQNLIAYNNKFVIGFKNGRYGFIEWSDKPYTNFEFEEIRYWNDTIAFVKKNSRWMLLNIFNKEILLDEIKDYKVISNENNEAVAIFHRQNGFGVVSSKKGIVIPGNFSDIKNLGSADKPFYFTEKHIEEASIFVVIYYSKNGDLITKQVYEQEDYERIYCPL